MEKLQQLSLEINGEKLVFDIRKDFTKPCPTCGVSACGQEDFLYYEKDNQKITIIIDGSLFLDAIIGKYLESDVDYLTLPAFIREWNECSGWAEADDYNGYLLDNDSFQKSMVLFMAHGFEKTEMEILQEMQILAREALDLNAPLKIIRS